MRNELSPKAKTLRQEIKTIVAQSVPKMGVAEENQLAVFTENAHGDRSYEGKLFEDKVSRLVNEMGLTVWEFTCYQTSYAHY